MKAVVATFAEAHLYAAPVGAMSRRRRVRPVLSDEVFIGRSWITGRTSRSKVRAGRRFLLALVLAPWLLGGIVYLVSRAN